MTDKPNGNSDTVQDKKGRSAASRALIITLTIVSAVVVYAFAFQKTDIGLEEIKDPGRRESLVRIIRGLVRPNIIEYAEEETFITVEILTPCPADGFTPAAVDPATPYIIMDPTCAEPGSEVTVRGFGFKPAEEGPLSFIPPSGVTLKLANIEADDDGNFEVVVELSDRPDEVIQHLRMTTTIQTGSWMWTDTATDTWDKIIETVMLALVATTLGTFLAVPLSFFSARNLMRAIRTPLASVTLFIVGLPLGIVVGRQFGRWVVELASKLMDRPVWLVIGLMVSIAAIWALSRFALPEEEQDAPETWLRITRIGALLLAGVGVLFAIDFLGFLLMQIGDALHGNLGWFDFLATFLINIGDIMTTFLTAVSAILVGFLGAGVGSRLGHAINDRAPRSIVDILRYPLGALAIGVLGLMIGSAINWMYDYGNENPAIAMATGAIMMVMVGGSITGRLMRPVRQRVPGIFGSLLGFFTVIAGIIGGIFAGIGLGKLAVVIVDAIGGGNGTVWAAALVGAILGTALAWATRRLDSLPSGLIAYYLSRSLFNAIRSVEPLVMAIVFVVWVGVGPFAGSLALALHTTAALAKLYSEQVESIMTGPMEAITATGATRLQNIIYAVVPQIVPPYIAFTLYRWDINVRMSTIIGFAGGGGIGFLLQQNINLLQYRDASVQMLAIAIVVSSLDFLSARIRERIV